MSKDAKVTIPYEDYQQLIKQDDSSKLEAAEYALYELERLFRSPSAVRDSSYEGLQIIRHYKEKIGG